MYVFSERLICSEIETGRETELRVFQRRDGREARTVTPPQQES